MEIEVPSQERRNGLKIEKGKQHTFSAREFDSNSKLVVRCERLPHDLEIYKVSGEWIARSGERFQKLEENQPTLLRVSLNVDVTAGSRGVMIHNFERDLSLYCSIEELETGDYADAMKNLISKNIDEFRDGVRKGVKKVLNFVGSVLKTPEAV